MVEAPQIPGISCSVLERQLGGGIKNLRKSLASNALAEIPHFRAVSKQRLFSRRCECVLWHPDKEDTVLVGSHGGDVSSWQVRNGNVSALVDGKGKGGSVIEMKLNPANRGLLATVSHDQCIKVHDLKAETYDTLHDTGDKDHWPTSIDFSPAGDIVACDNLGWLRMFDPQGLQTAQTRLFKCKVQQLQLHPFNPHVMITASNDRLISVFDLRKLPQQDDVTKKRNGALCFRQLNGIANSVCFCPHTGHRVLATCQSSELAVLQYPKLEIGHIYEHPNKFYQHMTGIEAVWHPLIPDVFSCGRYGGSDVERGIDIMQASTGKTLWHMKSKDLPGVTPINVFSPNGRWLVSASGHNVHAWRSCNDDQDPNTIGTQMSSSKRKIFENIKGAEKKNIAFQRVPGMKSQSQSPAGTKNSNKKKKF